MKLKSTKKVEVKQPAMVEDAPDLEEGQDQDQGSPRRITQQKEIKMKIKASREEVDEFERFSRQVEDVRPLFDEMSAKVRKMRAICAEKVYNPKSEVVFDELKAKVDEVAGLIRRKILAHQNNDKNQQGPFAEVKGKILATLINELVVQTNRYKEVLVQHESDMKERIARHLDEVADEQEVESEYRYDANMNTDTFFKRYVFKEDAQRARDHLKEKHRDIAKIEKDLVELNGIMQDIGQLVEYHNELLDQIEMNVEEGKAKVNLATQELAETRVIVQQIRRKKLMTFLTIGLIVVIVIVVIVVVAVIIPEQLATEESASTGNVVPPSRMNQGYIEDISSSSVPSRSAALANKSGESPPRPRTRPRFDVYYTHDNAIDEDEEGAASAGGEGEDEPPRKRRRELRTTKTNHSTPQYRSSLEDAITPAPPAPQRVDYHQHLRPPPPAVTPLEEQYLTRIAQVPFADLTFGQLLGSGFFGKVYKGQLGGQEVAIKRMVRRGFRHSSEAQLFINETSVFCELDHPNILKFLGASISPKGEHCIVTEYMAGGSLRRLLDMSRNTITEAKRRKIAKDVAMGVNYLHHHKPKIIHRDLSSSNILLDADCTVAKVGDFGLSRFMDETGSKMTCAVGALAWMAPEVYIGQTYTEKADVYSYAICLAELMTGEDPYQGMEPHIYASYAITNSLRPQLPETLDEKWKELMMACWHEDPELRPDFAEVVAYLDCYLPATSPPAPAPPLPTTQADVGDVHEDEVDDDGDDDDDDASGAGDVVERRSPEAKRPPPSDHKQHGDEAEEAEDSSPQRTHDPRATSSSAGYLLALAGEPKDKSGRERRCG